MVIEPHIQSIKLAKHKWTYKIITGTAVLLSVSLTLTTFVYLFLTVDQFEILQGVMGQS